MKLPPLLVPVTLLLLDLLYLPFDPAALLALITFCFSDLLILAILALGKHTFLVPPPLALVFLTNIGEVILNAI